MVVSLTSSWQNSCKITLIEFRDREFLSRKFSKWFGIDFGYFDGLQTCLTYSKSDTRKSGRMDTVLCTVENFYFLNVLFRNVFKFSILGYSCVLSRDLIDHMVVLITWWSHVACLYLISLRAGFTWCNEFEKFEYQINFK